MLNLDTHALLYAVTDDLTAAERRLLRRNPWSISAIVLWEVSKLAQLGWIEVDLDDPRVMRTLRSVRIWPDHARGREAEHSTRRRRRPRGRAGDSVLLSYPPANRDEDAFDDLFRWGLGAARSLVFDQIGQPTPSGRERPDRGHPSDMCRLGRGDVDAIVRGIWCGASMSQRSPSS